MKGRTSQPGFDQKRPEEGRNTATREKEAASGETLLEKARSELERVDCRLVGVTKKKRGHLVKADTWGDRPVIHIPRPKRFGEK